MVPAVRRGDAVQVASGAYAPGHLGELTPFLPFVDDVLERTDRVQRRLRALPSRVGVYYVLALALFPALSYTVLWRQLTASLRLVEATARLGDRTAPGPGACTHAPRFLQTSEVCVSRSRTPLLRLVGRYRAIA